MMRVDRLIAGRGVRYAVSELLLIVVGVTLALTANSYAGVRQRREEPLALQQIKVALESDLHDFEEAARKVLSETDEQISRLGG